MQPHQLQQNNINMASPSYRNSQVRTKLLSFAKFFLLVCYAPTSNIRPNVSSKHKQKCVFKGATQRSKIVREANWPPGNTQKKPNTNQKLAMCYTTSVNSQDNDQDMADSSSPSNNKRGQFTIHQPTQQKKTRNDMQADHVKYASQDLWFGFQAMELTASDNNILHHEINTPIRELLRLEFRESEAAEIHTTKISFPRVQQQRWPNTRTDGRSGHHYHIT
jgi:hypothetical protein